MAELSSALAKALPTAGTAPSGDAARLRDLSPQQWKSGAAAWLGWLFDGLDMHLYVLVAAPFVAELLGATSEKDLRVAQYSSWIQAAFLTGWALGGGFFGRVGDRLGRSRALTLTILTYASFTGLSFFAQTWWHLLLFRFLAALGIGGEWAVGASLLSETWPRRWRPWMAAVLQTGVNLGVMLAGLANFLLAGYPNRSVFLVGVLPALLVLWIRRAVRDPLEWEAAREAAADAPCFADLFRGTVRRTTILTLSVCALALTGHWAFLFWYLQHLRNLPEVAAWDGAAKSQLVSLMVWLVMLASIAGNFFAALLARRFGYCRAIGGLFLGYFLAMLVTYGVPRGPYGLGPGLAVIGVCQGVFALFTMYLPPLFPVLLRTSGVGFCFNIGRLAAALGTIVFGLFSNVGDYRIALLSAGFLFVPAAALTLRMPEMPPDETGSPVAAPEEELP
jgi:MFS family permease